MIVSNLRFMERSPRANAALLVGAAAILLPLLADTILGGSVGVGLYPLLLSILGLGLFFNALALDPATGAAPFPEGVIERLRARSDELLRFAVLTGQLGLLALVIRQFRIESPQFHETVVLLVAVGFVVHYFTPTRYRLLFFLSLSFVGIYLSLGLVNTAWIAAFGGILLGICHLPIAYGARVVLLLTVGTGLVVLRTGQVMESVWSAAIWPILGSMFMFRLMIYMYDLRHEKEPASLTQRLAYFFLLPNVAFPLFPVVDYQTFRRTYYDEEEHRIYQDGVHWITCGVLYLLAYRLVYQHLSIAPQEVNTWAELVQYLLASYMVIIRVAGQFHLIVGILHLFGFHLPPPFAWIFMASGFTDLWRRANTYWRDLMVKIIYNPVYYSPRLSGMSPTLRLCVSLVTVFVATWFLHAYQWFWIMGSFLLSWPDVLYWTVMGLLVLGFSLWESKKVRKRSLKPPKWSLRQALPRAVGVAATFSTMCVLFSLWNSQSLTQWFAVWSIDDFTLLSLLGTFALLVGIAFLVDGGLRLVGLGPDAVKRPAEIVLRAWATIRPRYALVSVTPVLLIFLPVIAARTGEDTGRAIQRLREGELNQQDATRMIQGYYENLLGAARYNPQLWEVYMKRPLNFQLFTDTEAGRQVGGFWGQIIVPSKRVVYNGEFLSTNRWAMRDKDYTLTRPQGTYRVGLIGASSVMGMGVGDEETFETLVEKRLNRERQGQPFDRYEILNFASPGMTPINFLPMVDRALLFQPNAVMIVVQSNDVDRTIGRLANYGFKGIEFPGDSLRRIVAAAVNGATSETLVEKRLLQHREEIVSWIYQEITRRCREAGVLPIWMYLPGLEPELEGPQVDLLKRAVRRTGAPFLDPADVYAGHDKATLRMREWDFHPNVKAHGLIADRLYEEIEKVGLLSLSVPASRKAATDSQP